MQCHGNTCGTAPVKFVITIRITIFVTVELWRMSTCVLPCDSTCDSVPALAKNRLSNAFPCVSRANAGTESHGKTQVDQAPKRKYVELDIYGFSALA
jgi:hypothetical protein